MSQEGKKPDESRRQFLGKAGKAAAVAPAAALLLAVQAKTASAQANGYQSTPPTTPPVG